MRIIQARFKANSFLVKNYKGSAPFLISKYVPPPLNQQIIYTVYLYDLFKHYMLVGSWFKEGTYLKIVNSDVKVLVRNNFALIHDSMIRTCNKTTP